jgi:hypothetical protein
VDNQKFGFVPVCLCGNLLSLVGKVKYNQKVGNFNNGLDFCTGPTKVLKIYAGSSDRNYHEKKHQMASG